MSECVLFVQIQGDSRILELAVPGNITEDELHKALTDAGVPSIPELFIFIDEAEEHVRRQGNRPVDVKHGARIHGSRCRRIQTKINYLDKTIERDFPPGTRVSRVKAWAVHEFHLDHKDAAEHVLQICNSTERPASDTPLHMLVRGDRCALCFDLVPEKRVEGADDRR